MVYAFVILNEELGDFSWIISEEKLSILLYYSEESMNISGISENSFIWPYRADSEPILLKDVPYKILGHFLCECFT